MLVNPIYVQVGSYSLKMGILLGYSTTFYRLASYDYTLLYIAIRTSDMLYIKDVKIIAIKY